MVLRIIIAMVLWFRGPRFFSAPIAIDPQNVVVINQGKIESS